MDLIVRFKEFYINFIYNLDISIPCFILRMGTLLIMTTVLLILAWYYVPFKTVVTQALTAFVSFALVLYLPLQNLKETGEDFFAFIVGLSFLSMIFIPNYLPFFLAPRLGSQIKLKRIIKCAVWGLFLLQILVTWGRL